MINKLNKILVIFVVFLAGLLILKILSTRKWEQYYYTGSVSNPTSFPIYILDISFSNKQDDTDYSFYKDFQYINNFESYWGKDEFYTKDKPSFLPEELIIKYIDFRTKDYYNDTIALPVEVIEGVFNEAKELGKLRNYRTADDRQYKNKLGLGFHVGIANDGNIIFWLLGNNYYKEFYRTQLKDKPLPATTYGKDLETSRITKDNMQEYLFLEIPEHVKDDILKIDVSNASYKDSIPVFFKKY